MDATLDAGLAALLPRGAAVNAAGHLTLGGIDVAELAARFGTPLYLYDDATIRAACRAYVAAFTHAHDAHVHYASKAYLAPWLCHLLREEGLGLDVVSGGELHVALASGVPAAEIRLHGNNKLPGELRDAVAAGVGRIVVDNYDELRLLAEIAAEVSGRRRYGVEMPRASTSERAGAGRRVPILLRLSPGVAAHTHEHLQTGLLDSKFGLPIVTGDALAAVRDALAAPALELRGYHAHVGSGAMNPQPIVEGLRRLLTFAREAHAATGYWPAEVCPGGGLGIAYERGERALPVEELAKAIFAAVAAAEVPSGMAPPVISVEPGRSVVGRAGVALYTVGARKDIAGVRRYVSVDGGMADNIRPALYGARYTALAATRMTAPTAGLFTVAGRYCESGDVLVREAALPALEPGDLLALPAAGAYCLAMSSGYNAAPRPAVVVVKDGAARLAQRRGTYDDLLMYDVT